MDFATSDDAAVYRQPDGSLLVATLDFFTPIVNNPYDFGAIAAANALSDVYAMGAQPLFALNMIGFPKNELPLEILGEILKGGSDVAKEAGIFVLGGHSIDDKEPKYGMVIIGRVENESDLYRNSTATVGDVLVLTKPLGTGIINTAIKHGVVNEANVQNVISVMRTLNRDAAELAVAHHASALTDVTGYGLLGHLGEMMTGAGVSARLEFEKLPVFDSVMDLIKDGEVPGGSRRNLLAIQGEVDFGDLSEDEMLLAADAQTSGGLLVSMKQPSAENYVREMREQGHVHTTIIGGVAEQGHSLIKF